MPARYDLAVVGSGPGGSAAALTAARRGLRVCLIDRDAWGGVCLNVGCIPTKALLAVAHLIRRVQHAKQLGVTIHGYDLDYAAVLARNARIISTLRRGLTEVLRREQVELIAGSAAFEHPTQLVVTHEGLTQRIDAERIVLATGGRPISGPWTFDERQMVSYRGLLALTAVPKQLLIIGGGVIGCEFASCFSAFGTQVTMVEQQSQLLPGEDADAVRWLTRRLESYGVTLKTGTTVQGLTSSAAGVSAILSDGTQCSAQQCLVAIGQQPNIDGLQLAAASVAAGIGVSVDAALKTSQPHIAAIGDCLERHGLAHWASAEGAMAVRNLLGDACETLEPRDVPRCVYTDPEIASIGVTSAHADEGIMMSRLSFGALGKGYCDDETDGFIKLFVEEATGRIRGATIVGAEASTLIHYAVLAIHHGLTAKQLARTVTAHPSWPESITEAAAHVYGESLVLASRTRDAKLARRRS